MKKTILTLLCLVPLTACDNRSIEQLRADRIAACKEMIRTAKPMPTEHLPLTERGKEIPFHSKWENCRAKVEDNSFKPWFNNIKDCSWTTLPSATKKVASIKYINTI